jgi:dynactin complex subunit
VDYDAIAMLNVSAAQELAKKVEALEAENAELKSHTHRLATLEVRTEALEAENIRLKADRDKFAALTARMEALEKSVSSKRSGSETIRRVALNQ